VFEDNSLAGNVARVQTWLMGGKSKTKFAEDCVGMLLPKTGWLLMTLHSQESGNNIARGYRRPTFVLDPPFMKCLVRSHIEALFWRWGLGEGIRYIGTKHKEVLTGWYCIKEMWAGLVDTVGVSLIKDFDRSWSWRTIADTACLLTSVKGLDTISPHKKEHSILLVNLNWVTKHALRIVLVKLKELQSLPVGPVLLF
jgi:hypothetical protein